MSTSMMAINPGNLPAWFATAGLVHLREGNVPGALAWYESEARRNPGGPHALFGLGAALLCAGQVKRAAQYLSSGLLADSSFNLGALLSELPTLKAPTLLAVAQQLKANGAIEAACTVLAHCLADPATDADIYVKADTLRRAWCEGVSRNASVLRLVHTARENQRFLLMARVMVLVVVLSALAVTHWFVA